MSISYNNNEEIDDSLSDNIHNVLCDGCNSTKIYSDRYKCLECIDYDLCGNCFEERRQTKKHFSGHPVAHFKIPKELFNQPIRQCNEITLTTIRELLAGVHYGLECDGCRTLIVGVRFKCDTCHNYNLCFQSMTQRVISKNHKNTHPLVATSNLNLIKIDINDIRKDNILGQGAFGQVYKAKWLSKNRQVACKVIQVTPQQHHLEKSFRKELSAYAELSGAFILKTFGFGDRILDNGIKECYLITEFMHRGSLANVIHHPVEKISLRRKLSMACHIVSGMRKLHAHTMIHCDIRSDNILVSKNFTAKIGDMGIAHIFDSDQRQTLIGCIPFMPPEFHRGDGQYDQSLDVFTYGLTLNELFTERNHRFIQSTKRVQLTKHSPVFSDLILQCIQDMPALRPTAFELEDILHKFQRAADRYIKEKYPNYTNEILATKDNVFINFYNEYHLQNKDKPKEAYLPPPKPYMNLDLIRQHFEDMMKQFHCIDEKNVNRNRNNTNWMKIAKYLDNPNLVPIVDSIKKEQRPLPHIHHAQQRNHEQFLHVIQNRRARTPNQMSPRFHNLLHHQDLFHIPDWFRLFGGAEDIEERMQRSHLEAAFRQQPFHFHHNMPEFK